MQDLIHSLKRILSFNNFPLLTVLTNVFFGYALGIILVIPGSELGGSIWIKVILTIGTCLFANYLMCLRKSFKGISRNTKGTLRPFLREAVLCAGLNASIFFITMTLFFLKPHIL